MYRLPIRNRKALVKNIRYYKKLHFPGKGSGMRLADEAGVLPQTISNWLKGTRFPTFEQLYRLAKVFDVSPLALCGMHEDDGYSRKTAHIAILRSVLECQKNALECDVNPHVIEKFLTEIKCLVENELASDE